MNRIIGADVSFWQDDPTTTQEIDFVKMRKAGAGFVIIRAGQNNWTDSNLKDAWRDAKAAGIPRGSYWFYDSRTDPKKQADLWIKSLGGDLGELPLWCDFEERYGGDYGHWKNWYNFVEHLKLYVPDSKIGIYTGYYYWTEKLFTATKAELSWWARFPLWIAAYNNTAPIVPETWKTWVLWQFTDSGDGKKYGVESREIDLNYYNGDAGKFYSQFGVEAATSDGVIDTSAGSQDKPDLVAKFGNTLTEYRRVK